MFSWDARKNINNKWSYPPLLFFGLFIIMGVSYTLSGIHKYGSPSWKDGTALFYLMDNPLSRDYFLTDLAKQLPIGIIKINTWLILGLEIIAAPFCFFANGRFWINTFIILLHLGIASMVNFLDLTSGMILFHLFLFLPRKQKNNGGILFYDGECGLCHKSVQYFRLLDQVEEGSTLKFAPLQGKTAKEKVPENLCLRHLS